MKNGKRPQLRVCSICGKSGHNRVRCPKTLNRIFEQISETPNKKTGVNFYIHHVNNTPTHSPHILDLKKNNTQQWKEVTAHAPDNNFNEIFHQYHQIPTTKETEPIRAENDWQHLFQNKITHEPLNFSDLNKVIKEEALAAKPIHIRKQIRIKDKLTRVTQKIKKSHANFIDGLIYDATQIEKYIRAVPWKKIGFAAAALCIIIITPFAANSYYRDVKLTTSIISDSGTAGFTSLQEATAAMMNADLIGAQSSLSDALKDLSQATAIMQTKHQWLQKIASIIPVLGDAVVSRQNILTAGQKIASGNDYLLKGIQASQTDQKITLTERLKIIIDHLTSALPNYQNALTDLSMVKTETLPLEYQQPFEDFKILFTALVGDIKNLSELGTNFQEIFGGTGLRRYLLVFQNQNELRPTGGFIGSFATMDVEDGQIIRFSLPAGGSYDLKGQLNTRLKPPAPLLLINNIWQFQDGNWFPDFETSAQKLMWFYRKSRNITVDGVIAINATVLERLLGILGPIQTSSNITSSTITIAEDNAIDTIQAIVESPEARATKKPKQILKDLAPQFIESIQNIKPKNILPILTNLQEALTKKEIQAYFTDAATEQTIKNFGWAGQILPTKDSQDYLAIINTNIGGQKSDAKIQQTINHQAIIDDDGAITDTVTIMRTHLGQNNDSVYGTNNVDYIRIYVPAGSQLISAAGFTWPDENIFHIPDEWAKPDDWYLNIEKEIDIDQKSGTRITDEFGKTAFGNWIITAPGQTTQVQFTYQLPFKVQSNISQNNGLTKIWQFAANTQQTNNYQLLVQKQSGIDSNFESQIVFPENWQTEWSSGNSIKAARNGIIIDKQVLDQDRVWSVLVKNIQ